MVMDRDEFIHFDLPSKKSLLESCGSGAKNQKQQRRCGKPISFLTSSGFLNEQVVG
jgi:hypothetical protein